MRRAAFAGPKQQATASCAAVRHALPSGPHAALPGAANGELPTNCCRTAARPHLKQAQPHQPQQQLVTLRRLQMLGQPAQLLQPGQRKGAGSSGWRSNAALACPGAGRPLGTWRCRRTNRPGSKRRQAPTIRAAPDCPLDTQHHTQAVLDSGKPSCLWGPTCKAGSDGIAGVPGCAQAPAGKPPGPATPPSLATPA